MAGRYSHSSEGRGGYSSSSSDRDSLFTNSNIDVHSGMRTSTVGESLHEKLSYNATAAVKESSYYQEGASGHSSLTGAPRTAHGGSEVQYDSGSYSTEQTGRYDEGYSRYSSDQSAYQQDSYGGIIYPNSPHSAFGPSRQIQAGEDGFSYDAKRNYLDYGSGHESGYSGRYEASYVEGGEYGGGQSGVGAAARMVQNVQNVAAGNVTHVATGVTAAAVEKKLAQSTSRAASNLSSLHEQRIAELKARPFDELSAAEQDELFACLSQKNRLDNMAAKAGVAGTLGGSVKLELKDRFISSADDLLNDGTGGGSDDFVSGTVSKARKASKLANRLGLVKDKAALLGGSRDAVQAIEKGSKLAKVNRLKMATAAKGGAAASTGGAMAGGGAAAGSAASGGAAAAGSGGATVAAIGGGAVVLFLIVFLLVIVIIGAVAGAAASAGNGMNVARTGIMEYINYHGPVDKEGEKYWNYVAGELGWASYNNTGQEWCACFVSWCENQNGFVEDGTSPCDPAVQGFLDYYNGVFDEGLSNKGDVHDYGSHDPCPGDLIIMKGTGASSHILISCGTGDGLAWLDAELTALAESGNVNAANLAYVQAVVNSAMRNDYTVVVHGNWGSGWGYLSVDTLESLGGCDYVIHVDYPGNGGVIPEPYGTAYTYMGWSMITNIYTDQYKLREAAGEHYDSDGFGIINDGSIDRYVIACTKKYGDVGDMVDFTLEDGTVLHCIIGDVKNQSDPGCNEWGHENGAVVVEFVVDKQRWYSTAYGGSASSMHANPGTSRCHPEWDPRVVSWSVVGTYDF